jgi:S1-C subfamily serine protease
MKRRKTTKWQKILWTIILLAGGSSAQAQTAQEIAKKAFASTVLLVMEDANGQPVSLGSGFFVRDGEIASNLHVVEGGARGYAKVIGTNKKHDIIGITATDPELDLVLLKISASGPPALALGDSGTVQVGEPVYAVGNPRGLEGTFSQGIISSIRDVGGNKLLQITAPISPGSSGGPVLNDKGDVIGVSVATFRGGQNLNFAIPSLYLKSLLERSGRPEPLAQAKAPKTQKSILADLGGRSTEGVSVVLFQWEYEGLFSFSLRNHLRQDVKGVSYMVIFYAQNDIPIHTVSEEYHGLIPAGLAKRAGGVVSNSVAKLTRATGRLEVRILNFKIVE